MTSLCTSQTLCQWIFSQWAIKELFIDENDSVREWWFRSWLDRYVSNKLSVGFYVVYENSSKDERKLLRGD